MARPLKSEAKDIAGDAVQACIALLEREPVASVTMARIAAAVGCTAPALYSHFRNKEALLRAVHDDGFRRLFEAKRAAATRGDDAFDRLRRGGLAYMRFALDHPALYTLMFSPPAALEDRGNPFEEDLGRRALDLLTASVKACQAAGYLPGAKPESVAFTLWSLVHGAATLILQGRTPVPGQDRDALAQSAVETAMAFVAATHPGGRPPGL
ncbi:MAG: TetR/AcrR family transcriptional regulator [Alphaproteobacteria bacterium]|nr:TetR/AcrR family transcriptional regulator [Alphaproteobacteria bacterium]